jgi:hypothetical protein
LVCWVLMSARVRPSPMPPSHTIVTGTGHKIYGLVQTNK